MDEFSERDQQAQDDAERAATWTSPMPLSMPPFSSLESEQPSSEPPASEAGVASGLGEEPTREQPYGYGAAALPPFGAQPGAGGAMPPGGQPPFPPFGYGWPPGGPPPAASGPQPPSHPRRHRAMAALGVVALLAGGLGAGLGIALGGTNSSSSSSSSGGSSSSSGGTALSATGTKPSVSAIASSVDPAIVDIQTNVASPSCEAEQAAGTGMIISSSGEVLTNNHVVEDATTIKVTIEKHGTHTAKVVGVDPTKDVALLQIEGVSGLPYVSFANSSTVTLGTSVVAIGNALGLEGTPTVVSGTVTALGRTITASDEDSETASETLHGLIETNADIVPGDSGGPLLNSSGKVIGMDTAALSDDSNSSTIGFAIPINEARTLAGDMEKGKAVDGITLGASPFLGVYEDNGAVLCGDTSGGLGFGGFGYGGSSTGTTTPSSSVSGVTIAGVVGSSPAATAGLAAGDVITSIDGTATPTWSALQKVIQAKAAGDKITIDYENTSGTAKTVTVTLTSLPK